MRRYHCTARSVIGSSLGRDSVTRESNAKCYTCNHYRDHQSSHWPRPIRRIFQHRMRPFCSPIVTLEMPQIFGLAAEPVLVVIARSRYFTVIAHVFDVAIFGAFARGRPNPL